jgi:hypothetical protein
LAALVVVALFTCGPVALAAAQTTNGAIAGVVSDAQGGVLPGVSLTMRNTDTGLTRSVVTDESGRYRVAGLPPGRYEMQAELQSFGTARVTDIILQVGTELLRNVTLQLTGLQESVSVTADAPLIATSKVEVSGVVTQEQMQMLPLASRQPMDLTLLMPGTNQDAVRARRANANVGAGAFTNGTAMLVDGVGNKETNTGDPRQDFPQAAVREFKVFLSQSPAQYGWTAGGVVSLVTKSGTNLFTGEIFEYFRHKSLNSQDVFEKAAGKPEADFSRQQFGGALGGPVVRDRVHFFAAAERTKTNLYKTVIVQAPQFYGNLDGVFASPEYSNMVFTRGDVQINQQQTAFVRYAWQDSDFTCEGCSTSSAAPFFSGTGGIQQKRYALAGAHTWVLSSRVFNEVRGQWSSFEFRQHPPGARAAEDLYDYSAKRVSSLTPIYNFPSLSWGNNSNTYSTNYSRQLRDDMTITAGGHTWKFGAGVHYAPNRSDNPSALGAWTFSADQPFDPTRLSAFVPLPGTVRQFASAELVRLPTFNKNVMWDTYIEDEWRLLSSLTLQLGLRYDVQTKIFNEDADINDKKLFPTTGTPNQVPRVDFSKRGDKNNIGPRVGVAWDVTNDGGSVVRAGYGIYYNPANVLIKADELQNFRQFTATLTNPSYPDPYAGRDPLTLATTSANLAINANDVENLESAAYTLGVSQELTSTLAIHVDGVHNRMTKVPMAIDVNPRSGGATGVRPLPQFGRILEVQSIGWADYTALLVRLEKRFDSRYMYTVSYTLMDTDGIVNNSGFRNTVTNSAFVGYDRGPNNNDRRHSLVASGAVQLPFDFNLSGVFTARSTMPFGALAGIDLNGDNAQTDYAPGTTRNVFNRGKDAEQMALVNAWRARQAPTALNPQGLPPLGVSQIDANEFFSVDLRASKAFVLGGRQRFEVIAQAFNVLNRTNLRPAWTTNTLSNAFGTSTSANNMRQAEVAVRFAF